MQEWGGTFFPKFPKISQKFSKFLKKTPFSHNKKGNLGKFYPPISDSAGELFRPRGLIFIPSLSPSVFFSPSAVFTPSLKKYAAAAKYTQRERECTKEECSEGRFLLSNFIVKDSLSAAEDLGEFLTFPERRQRIYDEM